MKTKALLKDLFDEIQELRSEVIGLREDLAPLLADYEDSLEDDEGDGGVNCPIYMGMP